MNSYEKIAPCGHPEKYWKVEVNHDAWCIMCALEDMNEKSNIAIKALNDIYALKSNHYFGLQFEVFEIVLNAFKNIEKIKGKF